MGDPKLPEGGETGVLKRLDLVDEDGEKLDIKRVGGFGEPMASLFVVDGQDPKDQCGIRLNLDNARRLRDWLTGFIERGENDLLQRT